MTVVAVARRLPPFANAESPGRPCRLWSLDQRSEAELLQMSMPAYIKTVRSEGYVLAMPVEIVAARHQGPRTPPAPRYMRVQIGPPGKYPGYVQEVECRHSGGERDKQRSRLPEDLPCPCSLPPILLAC